MSHSATYCTIRYVREISNTFNNTSFFIQDAKTTHNRFSATSSTSLTVGHMIDHLILSLLKKNFCIAYYQQTWI